MRTLCLFSTAKKKPQLYPLNPKLGPKPEAPNPKANTRSALRSNLEKSEDPKPAISEKRTETNFQLLDP